MANIKTVQERHELHKAIWSIADELRGSVGSREFKNYVLGTVFYRYISDRIRDLFKYCYIKQTEIDNEGILSKKVWTKDLREKQHIYVLLASYVEDNK